MIIITHIAEFVKRFLKSFSDKNFRRRAIRRRNPAYDTIYCGTPPVRVYEYVCPTLSAVLPKSV